MSKFPLSGMKLSTKIPLAIAGLSALTAGGVGVASFVQASMSVEHQTRDRLSDLTEARSAQLTSYLASIREDLVILAGNEGVQTALREFDAAYHDIEGDPSATLKQTYIRTNPNPLGKKHLLDKGPALSGYDEVHGRHHPWFRTLLEARGYYDVFLFNTDGDLVYTVFKEEDFSTNFATNGGEWWDTDLGAAFREGLERPLHGMVFKDFRPYKPSYDVPAAFMSTPIMENGRPIGVLAIQMPIGRINAIMNGQAEAGDTVETIIVGQDGLLRSDSRLTEKDDILSVRLDNPAVKGAIQGQSASGKDDGYRATATYQVATPFEFEGVRWAIVGVNSRAAMTEPLYAMAGAMLLTALPLCLLVGLGGMSIGRSIVRPLRHAIDQTRTVAAGRTDLKISGTDRSDEIGELARALDIFRDNARERLRLERATAADRDREHRRQIHLDGVVERFRECVSSVLGAVTKETDVMATVAHSLRASAIAASTEANAAERASDGAAGSVSSVAAASEELSVSIREIAEQAQRANGVVAEASRTAAQTNSEVEQLKAAAGKIGAVVSLIRDIAEQTNLLALNATIEAARAGDSGRGFSVVAEEVKSLAGQTAKATEDIQQQIGSVQASTQDAARAIQQIAETIARVDSYTSTIVVSVEQQDAATREISESIGRAAGSSAEVQTSMRTVTDTIAQTSRESDRVASATERLRDAAGSLSMAVDDFLAGVVSDLDERRSGLRVKMREVVVVSSNGRRLNSLVLDASETGARIDLIEGVRIGDRITIEGFGGLMFEGVVVRAGQDGFGVRFDSEVTEAPWLLAA